MSEALIGCAEALTAVLAEENDALRRVDYRAAGALLARKEAALAALRAAGRPQGGVRDAIRPALQRMMAEVEENRRLLERAIRVQRRVIGVVASAGSQRRTTTFYGRSGAYAAGSGAAGALSARA